MASFAMVHVRRPAAVPVHEQPLLRPPYLQYGSLPWNNRVQTYDSTFSLARAPDAWLGYWGVSRFYSGANAVPIFDDSLTYWSRKAPDASVLTPTYGLLLRVLGQAADGSAALVGLGRK